MNAKIAKINSTQPCKGASTSSNIADPSTLSKFPARHSKIEGNTGIHI